MILAIIQARMGSSRFPGKMMALLAGKPLIWYVMHRVKKAKAIDKVVLATSEYKDNVLLMKEVKGYGIDAFAGNENDVLDRFYQCAKSYGATDIVRITGDCPLVDSAIIDDVIMLYKNEKVDYASNVHPPTYPDGMDVEVFSFRALEKAWKEASLNSEREHVTPYIWKNKAHFTLANLTNDENLSKLRLTVDEKEDLALMNILLKRLQSPYSAMDEIIAILKKEPSLLGMNSRYIRNEGYAQSLHKDKMRKSNIPMSRLSRK